MIENENLYVFRSKRSKPKKNASAIKKDDSVKILKLTKNMTVEIKSISRKHGQCVLLKEAAKSNVTFCTLFPVLLNPSFFRDDEYSQVVANKKFSVIRNQLFGQCFEERPYLKELSMNRATSQTRHNRKKNEWSRCIDQEVVSTQNTAAMHLAFALDATIKLIK